MICRVRDPTSIWPLSFRSNSIWPHLFDCGGSGELAARDDEPIRYSLAAVLDRFLGCHASCRHSGGSFDSINFCPSDEGRTGLRVGSLGRPVVFISIAIEIFLDTDLMFQ
jgi:hypothetical protein